MDLASVILDDDMDGFVQRNFYNVWRDGVVRQMDVNGLRAFRSINKFRTNEHERSADCERVMKFQWGTPLDICVFIDVSRKITLICKDLQKSIEFDKLF